MSVRPRRSASMMMMTVAGFGMLAMLVTSVSAISIISQVQNVVQLNGQLQTNTSITVQCVASDFGVNYTFHIDANEGSPDTLIVNCNQPERIYVISFYAVNPDDGEQFTSQVCAVQNTANYVGTNATAEPIPFNPNVLNGQRTLLSFSADDPPPSSRDVGRRLLSETDPDDPDDPMGRKLMASEAAGVSSALTSCVCSGSYLGAIPLLPVLGSIVAGASNPNFCAGSSGINAAALQALNTSVTDLGYAFGNYSAAQTAFNTVLNNTIKDLLNFTVSQQAFDAATTARLNAIAQQANTTKTTLTLLIQGVQQDVNNLNTSVVTLAGAIQTTANALANLANETQTDINILAAELAQQAVSSNAAFAQTLTLLANNQATALGQLRATQMSLVGLASTVKAAYLDTNMQNAQNAQLQAKIAVLATTPDQFNERLRPFTEDLGTPPVATDSQLPSAYRDILVDTWTYRYITGTGANPVGHITSYSMHCNPYYLVLAQYTGMTWQDVVFTWGPYGCDTTYQSSTSACQCYMVVSADLQCALPQSGGVITPSGLSGWVNALGITETTCSGNAISGTFAGNMGQGSSFIYDLANFTDYMMVMSARGIYPNTYIQLYSQEGAQYAQLYWNPLTLNMTNFLYLLSPTNSSDVLNIYFGFMNQLTFSMQYINDNLNFYSNAIFGTLPNYLTQAAIFFMRFVEGSTGRCTIYTMMSYSNYFLTVSIPELDQIITNVQTWLNGVSTIVSDVTFTNPYSSLAVTDQSFMWDPAFSTTKIWNMAPTEGIVAPFAQKRCNDPFYTLVANQTQFSRDIWSYINGVNFDHTCGGNVATYWETTIDGTCTPDGHGGCTPSPTYGLCTAASIAPGGGYCVMRQHFGVQFLGIFDNANVTGTMILSDKDGTYLAQIYVPSGQISLTIGSSCPTVDPPVAAAGDERIYRIHNPISSVNQIEVTQIGGCPQTTIIDLAPLSYYDFRVYYCPFVSPYGSELLSFSYLVSGTTYQNCSGQIDVSITPTSLGAFTGAIAGNFSEILRGYTSDTVLIQLQKVQNTVMSLMYQNFITQVQSQLSVAQFTGVPIPVEVIANYTKIIQAAHSAANASANVIANAQSATYLYNLTDLLIDYNAAWNAEQINATLAAQQAASALDAISGVNNQLAIDYAKLQAAEAAENRALANVTKAVNNFGQALINALGTDVASGSGGTDALSGLAAWGAAIAGIGSDILNAGAAAVTALGNTFTGLMGGLFDSSLGNLAAGIVIIAIICAFLCCLVPLLLPLCRPGGSSLPGLSALTAKGTRDAAAGDGPTGGKHRHKLTREESQQVMSELRDILKLLKHQIDNDPAPSHPARELRELARELRVNTPPATDPESVSLFTSNASDVPL